MRQDGRRFAQAVGEAGRTVREMVGALKGRGNLGAAVMVEGFDPAFLLPLREKVGRVSGSDEGSLSRVTMNPLHPTR